MRLFSRNAGALALLSLGTVNAFWRMNCAVIQRGRIDPLVNFGAIAAHSHTIVGGSNIGINATYNSLLNSRCTSCEVGSDKSAYWTPQLFYKYPNGSFYEVYHSGMVAYYLGRGPNTNNTIPFPKGLNILSGDKSARSYDNQTYTWGNATYPGRPVADRVSFACLDTSGPLAEQPYMFRTQCDYGLRAQIHFQSCWNGKDLYKQDNSHVAYQSQIDNGICPPTHPFQIPHLFLETLYSVGEVPDQTDDGLFVFSQGDPTGYGMHGDFQNGWESAPLAAAVKNCLSTANFGQISECPDLQASQSDGYPYNCPERPPQIAENVTGLISQLPGCITITYGPAAAPAASMNCAANIARPVVSSTVDSSPVKTIMPAVGSSYGDSPYQQYLGCYNDSSGSIRTLNSVSLANYAVMTVSYCQAWCNNQGYRLSGLEYGQECHCDNAINPSAGNGFDSCNYNCGGSMIAGGSTMDVCGGVGYISVYNNTDPAFNANGSDKNSAGNVKPALPLSPFPSNYLGCATDSLNNAGRALTGPSTDDISMTTEFCAAFCAQGVGYQYYGTEYGTQCYCGNALGGANYITNVETTIQNTTCNMRCSGAGDELCGGPNAVSLYTNTAYTPPKIKSPIGKYVTKQCLTDPMGAAGRALQGTSMSSTTMTAEVCVKFCLGKHYHYAGIEYGQECYCGNTIATSTGAKQQTCVLANLMTCPGNSLEYCGAGGLMNLYYSATL